jgi:hypothetical protein
MGARVLIIGIWYKFTKDSGGLPASTIPPRRGMPIISERVV